MIPPSILTSKSFVNATNNPPTDAGVGVECYDVDVCTRKINLSSAPFVEFHVE